MGGRVAGMFEIEKSGFAFAKRKGRVRCLRRALILLCLAAFASLSAWPAGEISVRALVERSQVYQGEPFAFQIQVHGSNKVEIPQLKSTDDFTADFLGGQDASMRMSMNFNGQTSEQVNEGYNLTWRITPKRTGSITLPVMSVKAEGRAFQTQPVTVQVVKPEETSDFKLRQSLSQSRVYVGEPVTLTVTWYISKDVRNVQFSAPVLGGGDFFVVDPHERTEPSKRYVRLGIQGQEVTAVQEAGSLEGRQYTTISFKRVLIPKKPGALKLDPATVACEAPSGQRASRGFFDDFFSMGLGGSYQRVVVQSNAPILEVLDVPPQGRPANFSGNVGHFSLEASAQPTDVKVGDPISLTLKLSGPSYLEGVKPPRLDLQEDLAKDFKVPEEISPAKIEGGKAVFIQTLRAKTPGVREIPPVELSYFDTKDGAFKVVRTQAIPIHVEATRVVTAWDAEGSAARPESKELKSFAGGSRPITRMWTPSPRKPSAPWASSSARRGSSCSYSPRSFSWCSSLSSRCEKSAKPTR